MENKKTKLTISGKAKQSTKDIGSANIQGKRSVIIEKSQNKFVKKGSSSKPSGFGVRQNFSNKPFSKPFNKPTFSNQHLVEKPLQLQMILKNVN